MDENKEVAVTETAEVVSKPTFDELLKDPEYQAEFDRKAEGMKKKWHESWQKKAEKERSEAEALAKMSQEEKYQHEISKLMEELEQEKRVNASRALKEEALKIAQEKNINVSLLDMIDYSNSTAESVKEKLELIGSVVSKAVEDEVNNRLKQPRPQEVRGSHVSSEKAFLDEKYKDNPYYKK